MYVISVTHIYRELSRGGAGVGGRGRVWDGVRVSLVSKKEGRRDGVQGCYELSQLCMYTKPQ